MGATEITFQLAPAITALAIKRSETKRRESTQQTGTPVVFVANEQLRESPARKPYDDVSQPRQPRASFAAPSKHLDLNPNL